MNRKQIAQTIRSNISNAPSIRTGRLTIHCDKLKLTCDNDHASLETMARRFDRSKSPHSEEYLQAKLASKGPICRKEPIARLIKRYPEDTEAFTLLDEGCTNV